MITLNIIKPLSKSCVIQNLDHSVVSLPICRWACLPLKYFALHYLSQQLNSISYSQWDIFTNTLNAFLLKEHQKLCCEYEYTMMPWRRHVTKESHSYSSYTTQKGTHKNKNYKITKGVGINLHLPTLIYYN